MRRYRKLKESYSDINNNNVWDAYDIAIETLGADELCEALAKALGTDALSDNLRYIFRVYDIPFGDDEDEFEESCNRRHSMRERSGDRRKITQRELKDMIRKGTAEDITNISFDEANDLYDRGYDVIAVSSGVYGINGALLQMNDTGDQLAITARNSVLFQLV